MALNLSSIAQSIRAALRIRRSDPGGQAFASGGQSYYWNDLLGRLSGPETATQVAAIWACMDVIAGSLSSSDWNIYAGVRGEDSKEALPRDRLQEILNDRFNVEMTAQSGKRAMLLNAVGWGMGYAEIERDLAGRPAALWPVPTHRVEPRRDFGNGRLFFRVTQEYGGGWVDMEQEDLVIIRGASLVGFAGDSTMARAIRTVATALAIDAYTKSYFENNAQLGTVFVYKGGNMDDTNYTRAKESLQQKHAGAAKAYTTGLFTGEWDIKVFGNDMKDSTTAELKTLTVEDICRYFHVPPHKIAHLLRSTNNNIEHQGLEFSRDTLRPWKVEIEQELGWKLVAARGPRKFFELDLDWAEQGDYKSRMEAYAIGRNMGVFSANDVLRKLGENTIGPDGDIRIVQGANVRLEDVGAAYAQPGTADEPAGSEAEDEDEDDTLRAWLTQVYQRVQNRVDHTEARDGIDAARQKARPFAVELVTALGEHLGDRLPAALTWAQEVINGAEPNIAARAALEKKS